MFWEADEAARCVAAGKKESERMPHAHSISIMKVSGKGGGGRSRVAPIPSQRSKLTTLVCRSLTRSGGREDTGTLVSLDWVRSIRAG